MKAKRFLTPLLLLIFMFVLCLGLTACSEIQRARDERKEQLMAVQGKGGHYFITRYNGNHYVNVSNKDSLNGFLIEKVENDGIIDTTNLRLAKDAVNANKLHNEFMYFTIKYDCDNDDSQYTQAVMVFGYFNLQTDAVTYFGSYISESADEYSKIDIMPYKANDNYYMFMQYYGTPPNSVFYVIDVKNNILIEKVNDLSPYIDGTENDNHFVNVGGVKYELVDIIDNKVALKCNDDYLWIDYDYVLMRSEEMQEIDSIVGELKLKIHMNILSYKNRVYIIIQSWYEMFGTGELLPVVFEYIVESDTFEYIGCADGDIVHFIGVVPYTDN